MFQMWHMGCCVVYESIVTNFIFLRFSIGKIYKTFVTLMALWQITFNFEFPLLVKIESAKLRALQAHVPYVPRALRVLVLHVPHALRTLVPYGCRALCYLVSHVLCVLPILVSHVISCFTCPSFSCLASFMPSPFLPLFSHASRDFFLFIPTREPFWEIYYSSNKDNM